jgi:hypothetical protein
MKQTGQNRGCLSWLVLALASALGLPLAGCAAAPPASAPQPTAAELEARVNKASAELKKVVPTSDLLDNAHHRADVKATVVPLLHQYLDAVVALGQSDEKYAAKVEAERIPALAMLDLYGDDDTVDQLHKMAAGTDPDQALVAKGCLLLVDWWRSGDVAVKTKTIEAFSALARQTPADPRDHLTTVALLMLEVGAINNDLTQKVQRVVIEDLKGPAAQRVAVRIKEQMNRKDSPNKTP